MNDIRVKPELLQVLSALEANDFTVAELTQAYLEHPKAKHQSKKAARQFVYRTMVRMMKVGLMERLPDSEGWPRYRMVENFREAGASQGKGTAIPPTIKPLSDQPPKAATSANLLKDRLSKHRSDMLCAMGEAEEYNALCTELPALRGQAQALYNEARERSAILLGKIKALECLLTQQQA